MFVPSAFPKTAKEMQEAGPSAPSAPLQHQLTPPLTPNTPLTPTSPDRFSSSECVVCMEHEVRQTILILNSILYTILNSIKNIFKITFALLQRISISNKSFGFQQL